MNFFCSLISGIALYFLLFMPAMVLGNTTNPVLQFFQGDYSDLQAEAINQGRPYFIYFYNEGCSVCRMLEDRTFQYTPLIYYADTRYIPFKVNAEQTLSGRSLADDYGVKGYPMILIFGENGEVWDTVFGYTSGRDLLRVLRDNRESHTQKLSQVIDLTTLPEKTPEPKFYKEPKTFSGDVTTLSLNDDAPSREFNIVTRQSKQIEGPDIDLSGSAEQENPPEENTAEIFVAKKPNTTRPMVPEVEEAFKTTPTPPKPQSRIRPQPKPPVPPVYTPKYSVSTKTHALSSIKQTTPRHTVALNPFGIWVGNYSNLREFEINAYRYERLWHGDIWAHKTEYGYDLILGSYETEEEAIAYAAPMKKIGMIRTEIIDFRKLIKK